MKSKRVWLSIIGVLALALVIIGMSYAYWLITATQDKQNVISSACLDITITGEQNEINLPEQFPISDDEGKELTPYTFTINNKCNTSVDYKVNLESLGTESTALSKHALKVVLNDDEPLLLRQKLETEPTLESAYASNTLTVGTLGAKGTKEYNLRIWIDEEASTNEINKTYTGKITVSVGQGIYNNIKEGTLAYDIVSKYNGQGSTPVRSEHTEAEGSAYVINYSEMPSEAVYYGDSIKYDSDGYIVLGGNIVKATLDECRDGTKSCGSYTFLSTDENEKGLTVKMVWSFVGYFDLPESALVVADISIGMENPPIESQNGLFKLSDDLGDSYYFRGDVDNNYVKFGKWSETDTSENAGKDMYWRILRINGDGTIRLIYDGTGAVENGVAHTSSIGSSKYNSGYPSSYNGVDYSKYVGYTYDNDGIETDSELKAYIDNWYKNNLDATYGKYIADGIFCNDRTVVDSDAAYDPDDPDQAYMYIIKSYKGLTKSSLLCEQKEDRYTTSKKMGMEN